MKLCMVGTRGHYYMVLQELKDMPEVTFSGMAPGFADEDLSGFSKRCAEYGLKTQVFSHYRGMLDAVNPDIVCVFGPYESHAEMTVEAFRRGIHVLCEKPLATLLEDYTVLRDAFATSGVHFAAMTWMRYDPAMYTCWEAVRAGKIGRVRLIQAQKSYTLGRRADFYLRRETSSGIIPWVGSHAIDLIAWMGGEKFRSVYGAHSRQFNHDHGDLEMSSICQFTLTGEVFASASMDYLNPANASSHGDDRIRVAGTDGVVEVRGGQVFLTNGEQKGTQTLPAVCTLSGLRDFVGCVREKKRPLLDGWQSLAVAEACLLARQSADEGKPITFPPDRR